MMMMISIGNVVYPYCFTLANWPSERRREVVRRRFYPFRMDSWLIISVVDVIFYEIFDRRLEIEREREENK